MIPNKKICPVCKIEKPRNCFAIRVIKNKTQTLRRECRSCQNAIRRERYKNDPEVRKSFLEKNKKYAQKNRLKIRQRERNWEIKNKEKLTLKRRERYLKNRDNIKLRSKERYIRNRIDAINSAKEYYLKNKKNIRERQRKNHKKRKMVDPAYVIMKSLRSRISAAIKRKGEKCYKTKNLIGCTVQELIKHLESKFSKGMSWDNYGFFGWHIDHIKPCDSFNLVDPEQQKKCFHYTNLQPLWMIENIKKSNKTGLI